MRRQTGAYRSVALAGGQSTLGELKSTRKDDFRKMLVWGDRKFSRELVQSGVSRRLYIANYE
jgi:hypothetical protein